MLKLRIAFISAVGCLAIAVQSQAKTTNGYPLTSLENLEYTTGQLVVKGTLPIGNVSFGSTTITVICKEDYVALSGGKLYGIAVNLKSSGVPEDLTVVDYDEMDALLRSVDYVSKVDVSVTSLPSFSAGYTTKAGLRIAAFNSSRAGRIEFALRGSHFAKRILLTPDQLSQFYNLLALAKSKIEELRTGTTSEQN